MKQRTLIVLFIALAFSSMQTGDSHPDTVIILGFSRRLRKEQNAQTINEENPYETEHSSWEDGSQQPPSSEMEEDDGASDGQGTLSSQQPDEDGALGEPYAEDAELLSDEREHRV